MKRKIISLLIATLLVSVVLTVSVPVFATKPGRGYLYYKDQIVRTFVPNGKLPSGKATDPLYAFSTQDINVIRYAPGDKEYHGGHWAVYAVSWNVDPYLITNTDDLDAAEEAGDINIARNLAGDVLCPIQPGSMWNPNA